MSVLATQLYGLAGANQELSLALRQSIDNSQWYQASVALAKQIETAMEIVKRLRDLSPEAYETVKAEFDRLSKELGLPTLPNLAENDVRGEQADRKGAVSNEPPKRRK